MKCKQYQELMMRDFDHNLNPEERKIWNDHLNVCPECRNLYQDLHRILTPMEIPVLIEPDPGLEQLVLERIQTLPAVKPFEDKGLAKIIYGSLAVALLFLLLFVHLTLREASFSQLLLQARQYFNFLSGIALNSQIIYRFITSVFGETVFALFREVQNICQAVILFGIVLIIKFTVFRPVEPRPNPG